MSATREVRLSDAEVRRQAADKSVRDLRDPRHPGLYLRFWSSRKRGTWHLVRGKKWVPVARWPDLTVAAVIAELPALRQRLLRNPATAPVVSGMVTVGQLLDWYGDRMARELKALLHVQPHLRLITHRETGATLKVVAADSDVVGGKKAVGVLIDEAWLFGKNPKAADMIREATGGLLSRPEGFIIWLTTQSNEPPAGVFRSKLSYARGVRDGRIDDNRFLPIIYEFSQEMIKSGEARNPRE